MSKIFVFEMPNGELSHECCTENPNTCIHDTHDVNEPETPVCKITGRECQYGFTLVPGYEKEKK